MSQTICIVDDDQLYLETMRKFIESQRVFKECDVHSYSNSSDPRIMKKEYDLYFLDIDMPEISGFELAVKIQKKYSDAIFLFVSSHNEFVYDSFKFSAFYFVRKDHFDADMNDALHRAYEKFSKREERYIVETRGNKAALRYSDILYFEKIDNKLLIATLNYGDFYMVKTMKALNEEIDLKKHHFSMINSGTCVNLACVTRLNGYDIYLKNNFNLRTSRRYFHDFKEDYEKYLMERDV